MSKAYEHPVRIVDKIKESNVYRYVNGSWYKWASTHYELIEFMEGEVDRQIEQQFHHVWQQQVALAKAADEKIPERPVVKKHTIDSTLRKLRTEFAYNPRPAGGLINFQNGVLDINQGKILPHSPDLFFVGAPAVTFDPEAKCDRWKVFLKEVLEDTESRQLLQRWFGYCLTSDTSLQKSMMLIGASRAGKGIIARILAEMIGNVNVAAPQLAHLGSEHGLQVLLNKTLAIIDESIMSFKTDKAPVVSNLLSIIGETPLAVNPKYKDPLGRVHLGCRFMFLANKLMNWDDSAEAMANRMMFLHFKKSFAGREDSTLFGTLRGELAGIFNWAIVGLHRLREEGFPVPKASQETIEESKRLNNPVLEFADDCLEYGDFKTTAKEVYAAYQDWCGATGRTYRLTLEEFSKRLLALGRITVERVQRGGTRHKQWTGVKALPT